MLALLRAPPAVLLLHLGRVAPAPWRELPAVLLLVAPAPWREVPAVLLLCLVRSMVLAVEVLLVLLRLLLSMQLSFSSTPLLRANVPQFRSRYRLMRNQRTQQATNVY